MASKIEPKRPQGAKTGLVYKRLLKIDTKISPAKTPQDRFRRATHENMKNATKSLREYEFDPPKRENYY